MFHKELMAADVYVGRDEAVSLSFDLWLCWIRGILMERTIGCGTVRRRTSLGIRIYMGRKCQCVLVFYAQFLLLAIQYAVIRTSTN